MVTLNLYFRFVVIQIQIFADGHAQWRLIHFEESLVYCNFLKFLTVSIPAKFHSYSARMQLNFVTFLDWHMARKFSGFDDDDVYSLIRVCLVADTCHLSCFHTIFDSKVVNYHHHKLDYRFH